MMTPHLAAQMQSLSSPMESVASFSAAPGPGPNFQNALAYPGRRASVPAHRQADLERLRKLKEEILIGYDPNFHAEPNPEALAALSLKHNPVVTPPPSNGFLTSSEHAIPSASEASRPDAFQRLRQASAPETASQTVAGVKYSLTVQPASRLASTPSIETNPPRSSKDINPRPDLAPTTIPASAAPNGVTNGNRPHTPAALTLTNGRHEMPTPQSLKSSSQPGTTHSTPGSSSTREPVKSDVSDKEPPSPSTRAPKVEPATSAAHKIPPRPNPGGPLGSSIPLPTAPREMILRARQTVGRPEPVLLKRSEVQAMEKEKERLANEEREARRKASMESSPIRSSKDASSVQVKSEPDTERRRGVEHDVYVPRSPSPPPPAPRNSDSSLLTADGRPRGVPHDIYVPRPSPPPVSAGPRDDERPKGVQHDVYVPPVSPARERELRAPRPSESSHYERPSGADTYRPEDDRERDRDRDRDRRLDPVDSRRSDSGDGRRADYRDEDRRRDRYDDPRDRGRSDSRSYPASRDPLDSKLSDTRARLPSPAPAPRRSLADRLDSRDLRPSAADTYRPLETYDSRDARLGERDPPRERREAAYVPPSPPRRAPSPARSLRRDSDYRPAATYSSPRSYEATRDWSRDDLAYDRRPAWADDDRQAPSRPAVDKDRDYGRDRVAPDPPRRDREDYDRRASSYSASAAPPARTEPRDWPTSAAPSTDYYRALDASKQATYASSTYSASDRYAAPTPATTSRVRPRSPSPPPAPPALRPANTTTTTTTTAFIPPSRPSHPESEVARNAKRMRLLEAQSSPVSVRQVSPVTSTITPSPSAAQPAPPITRQAPAYHPPSRDATAYDDRVRASERDTIDRDRREPRRAGSPMRDVRSEYPPTRARSPPPSAPAYRNTNTYSRSNSPGRYSTWDREGSRDTRDTRDTRRDTRDLRDTRDTRYSQRM